MPLIFTVHYKILIRCTYPFQEAKHLKLKSNEIKTDFFPEVASVTISYFRCGGKIQVELIRFYCVAKLK